MISISDMREKIMQYCSGRYCGDCNLYDICFYSKGFHSDVDAIKAYERLKSNDIKNDIKITPDELQAFLNGGK